MQPSIHGVDNNGNTFSVNSLLKNFTAYIALLETQNLSFVGPLEPTQNGLTYNHIIWAILNLDLHIMSLLADKELTTDALNRIESLYKEAHSILIARAVSLAHEYNTIHPLDPKDFVQDLIVNLLDKIGSTLPPSPPSATELTGLAQKFYYSSATLAEIGLNHRFVHFASDSKVPFLTESLSYILVNKFGKIPPVDTLYLEWGYATASENAQEKPSFSIKQQVDFFLIHAIDFLQQNRTSNLMIYGQAEKVEELITYFLAQKESTINVLQKMGVCQIIAPSFDIKTLNVFNALLEQENIPIVILADLPSFSLSMPDKKTPLERRLEDRIHAVPLQETRAIRSNLIETVWSQLPKTFVKKAITRYNALISLVLRSQYSKNASLQDRALNLAVLPFLKHFGQTQNDIPTILSHRPVLKITLTTEEYNELKSALHFDSDQEVIDWLDTISQQIDSDLPEKEVFFSEDPVYCFDNGPYAFEEIAYTPYAIGQAIFREADIPHHCSQEKRIQPQAAVENGLIIDYSGQKNWAVSATIAQQLTKKQQDMYADIEVRTQDLANAIRRELLQEGEATLNSNQRTIKLSFKPETYKHVETELDITPGYLPADDKKLLNRSKKVINKTQDLLTDEKITIPEKKKWVADGNHEITIAWPSSIRHTDPDFSVFFRNKLLPGLQKINGSIEAALASLTPFTTFLEALAKIEDDFRQNSGPANKRTLSIKQSTDIKNLILQMLDKLPQNWLASQGANPQQKLRALEQNITQHFSVTEDKPVNKRGQKKPNAPATMVHNLFNQSSEEASPRSVVWTVFSIIDAILAPTCLFSQVANEIAVSTADPDVANPLQNLFNPIKSHIKAIEDFQKNVDQAMQQTIAYANKTGVFQKYQDADNYGNNVDCTQHNAVQVEYKRAVDSYDAFLESLYQEIYSKHSQNIHLNHRANLQTPCAKIKLLAHKQVVSQPAVVFTSYYKVTKQNGGYAQASTDPLSVKYQRIDIQQSFKRPVTSIALVISDSNAGNYLSQDQQIRSLDYKTAVCYGEQTYHDWLARYKSDFYEMGSISFSEIIQPMITEIKTRYPANSHDQVFHFVTAQMTITQNWINNIVQQGSVKQQTNFALDVLNRISTGVAQFIKHNPDITSLPLKLLIDSETLQKQEGFSSLQNQDNSPQPFYIQQPSVAIAQILEDIKHTAQSGGVTDPIKSNAILPYVFDRHRALPTILDIRAYAKIEGFDGSPLSSNLEKSIMQLCNALTQTGIAKILVHNPQIAEAMNECFHKNGVLLTAEAADLKQDPSTYVEDLDSFYNDLWLRLLHNPDPERLSKIFSTSEHNLYYQNIFAALGPRSKHGRALTAQNVFLDDLNLEVTVSHQVQASVDQIMMRQQETDVDRDYQKDQEKDLDTTYLTLVACKDKPVFYVVYARSSQGITYSCYPIQDIAPIFVSQLMGAANKLKNDQSIKSVGDTSVKLFSIDSNSHPNLYNEIKDAPIHQGFITNQDLTIASRQASSQGNFPYSVPGSALSDSLVEHLQARDFRGLPTAFAILRSFSTNSDIYQPQNILIAMANQLVSRQPQYKASLNFQLPSLADRQTLDLYTASEEITLHKKPSHIDPRAFYSFCQKASSTNTSFLVELDSLLKRQSMEKQRVNESALKTFLPHILDSAIYRRNFVVQMLRVAEYNGYDDDFITSFFEPNLKAITQALHSANQSYNHSNSQYKQDFKRAALKLEWLLTHLFAPKSSVLHLQNHWSKVFAVLANSPSEKSLIFNMILSNHNNFWNQPHACQTRFATQIYNRWLARCADEMGPQNPQYLSLNLNKSYNVPTDCSSWFNEVFGRENRINALFQSQCRSGSNLTWQELTCSQIDLLFESLEEDSLKTAFCIRSAQYLFDLQSDFVMQNELLELQPTDLTHYAQTLQVLSYIALSPAVSYIYRNHQTNAIEIEYPAHNLNALFTPIESLLPLNRKERATLELSYGMNERLKKIKDHLKAQFSVLANSGSLTHAQVEDYVSAITALFETQPLSHYVDSTDSALIEFELLEILTYHIDGFDRFREKGYKMCSGYRNRDELFTPEAIQKSIQLYLAFKTHFQEQTDVAITGFTDQSVARFFLKFAIDDVLTSEYEIEYAQNHFGATWGIEARKEFLFEENYGLMPLLADFFTTEDAAGLPVLNPLPETKKSVLTLFQIFVKLKLYKNKSKTIGDRQQFKKLIEHLAAKKRIAEANWLSQEANQSDWSFLNYFGVSEPVTQSLERVQELSRIMKADGTVQESPLAPVRDFLSLVHENTVMTIDGVLGKVQNIGHSSNTANTTAPNAPTALQALHKIGYTRPVLNAIESIADLRNALTDFTEFYPDLNEKLDMFCDVNILFDLLNQSYEKLSFQYRATITKDMHMAKLGYLRYIIFAHDSNNRQDLTRCLCDYLERMLRVSLNKDLKVTALEDMLHQIEITHQIHKKVDVRIQEQDSVTIWMLQKFLACFEYNPSADVYLLNKKKYQAYLYQDANAQNLGGLNQLAEYALEKSIAYDYGIYGEMDNEPGTLDPRKYPKGIDPSQHSRRIDVIIEGLQFLDASGPIADLAGPTKIILRKFIQGLHKTLREGMHFDTRNLLPQAFQKFEGRRPTSLSPQEMREILALMTNYMAEFRVRNGEVDLVEHYGLIVNMMACHNYNLYSMPGFGFFPNVMQNCVVFLSILYPRCFAQIATGQGKTAISALHNLVHITLGLKGEYVTSSDDLSGQTFGQLRIPLKSLGIDGARIDSLNLVKNVDSSPLKVTSLENGLLYRLCQDINEHHNPQNHFVCADELDYLTFSQAFFKGQIPGLHAILNEEKFPKDQRIKIEHYILALLHFYFNPIQEGDDAPHGECCDISKPFADVADAMVTEMRHVFAKTYLTQDNEEDDPVEKMVKANAKEVCGALTGYPYVWIEMAYGIYSLSRILERPQLDPNKYPGEGIDYSLQDDLLHNALFARPMKDGNILKTSQFALTLNQLMHAFFNYFGADGTPLKNSKELCFISYFSAVSAAHSMHSAYRADLQYGHFFGITGTLGSQQEQKQLADISRDALFMAVPNMQPVTRKILSYKAASESSEKPEKGLWNFTLDECLNIDKTADAVLSIAEKYNTFLESSNEAPIHSESPVLILTSNNEVLRERLSALAEERFENSQKHVHFYTKSLNEEGDAISFEHAKEQTASPNHIMISTVGLMSRGMDAIIRKTAAQKKQEKQEAYTDLVSEYIHNRAGASIENSYEIILARILENYPDSNRRELLEQLKSWYRQNTLIEKLIEHYPKCLGSTTLPSESKDPNIQRLFKISREGPYQLVVIITPDFDIANLRDILQAIGRNDRNGDGGVAFVFAEVKDNQIQFPKENVVKYFGGSTVSEREVYLTYCDLLGEYNVSNPYYALPHMAMTAMNYQASLEVFAEGLQQIRSAAPAGPGAIFATMKKLGDGGEKKIAKRKQLVNSYYTNLIAEVFGELLKINPDYTEIRHEKILDIGESQTGFRSYGLERPEHPADVLRKKQLASLAERAEAFENHVIEPRDEAGQASSYRYELGICVHPGFPKERLVQYCLKKGWIENEHIFDNKIKIWVGQPSETDRALCGNIIDLTEHNGQKMLPSPADVADLTYYLETFWKGVKKEFDTEKLKFVRTARSENLFTKEGYVQGSAIKTEKEVALVHRVRDIFKNTQALCNGLYQKPSQDIIGYTQQYTGMDKITSSYDFIDGTHSSFNFDASDFSQTVLIDGLEFLLDIVNWTDLYGSISHMWNETICPMIHKAFQYELKTLPLLHSVEADTTGPYRSFLYSFENRGAINLPLPMDHPIAHLLKLSESNPQALAGVLQSLSSSYAFSLKYLRGDKDDLSASEEEMMDEWDQFELGNHDVYQNIIAPLVDQQPSALVLLAEKYAHFLSEDNRLESPGNLWSFLIEQTELWNQYEIDFDKVQSQIEERLEKREQNNDLEKENLKQSDEWIKSIRDNPELKMALLNKILMSFIGQSGVKLSTDYARMEKACSTVYNHLPDDLIALDIIAFCENYSITHFLKDETTSLLAFKNLLLKHSYNKTRSPLWNRELLEILPESYQKVLNECTSRLERSKRKEQVIREKDEELSKPLSSHLMKSSLAKEIVSQRLAQCLVLPSEVCDQHIDQIQTEQPRLNFAQLASTYWQTEAEIQRQTWGVSAIPRPSPIGNLNLAKNIGKLFLIACATVIGLNIVWPFGLLITSGSAFGAAIVSLAFTVLMAIIAIKNFAPYLSQIGQAVYAAPTQVLYLAQYALRTMMLHYHIFDRHIYASKDSKEDLSSHSSLVEAIKQSPKVLFRFWIDRILNDQSVLDSSDKAKVRTNNLLKMLNRFSQWLANDNTLLNVIGKILSTGFDFMIKYTLVLPLYYVIPAILCSRNIGVYFMKKWGFADRGSFFAKGRTILEESMDKTEALLSPLDLRPIHKKTRIKQIKELLTTLDTNKAENMVTYLKQGHTLVKEVAELVPGLHALLPVTEIVQQGLQKGETFLKANGDKLDQFQELKKAIDGLIDAVTEPSKDNVFMQVRDQINQNQALRAAHLTSKPPSLTEAANISEALWTLGRAALKYIPDEDYTPAHRILKDNSSSSDGLALLKRAIPPRLLRYL